MASPAVPKVSLPSINEMFPEHMMGVYYAPPPAHASAPRPLTTGSRTSAEQQDGLYASRVQSVGRPLPSTQTASYAAAPTPTGAVLPSRSPSVAYNEPRPSVQTFRVQVTSHVQPVQDHAYPYQRQPTPSEAGPLTSPYFSAPQALYQATSSDERKHCCPHCNKRFNRPSSLNIHVNTHTGAKPFECPYPGCNRKFNVNSNMRRHWRNHLTGTKRREPGPSSSPASPSPSPSEDDAPYTYTNTRPRSRSSPTSRYPANANASSALVMGGGPDTDRAIPGRPRAGTCTTPGCACCRPPYPAASVRAAHYAYPR